MVGVNSDWNLHDFSVDMGTTTGWWRWCGRGGWCCVRGAGSEDVRVYKEQGVNTVTVAVLVAESLMRATDTEAFIEELLAWRSA